MRLGNLLIFCCLFSIGHAQKPIVISEDFEPFYIGEYCSIYEDSTNLESIKEVRLKQDHFWEAQSQAKLLGKISRSNFWAKFEIENPSNQIVEMAISVENPDLDNVQFYAYEKEILVDSSELMGDIYPFANRNIHHRFFIHKIAIKPKSTLKVYCVYGKRGGKMIFNTKLLKAGQLTENLQHDTIKVISLQVMVVLAIIVGCLFFLLSREWIAFYYMVLNIVFLIWLLSKSGLGFQYFWPNASLIQQGSSVLSFSLYFLFHTIMIRALLKLKNKSISEKLFIAAITVQILGILILLSPLLIKLQDVRMHYKLISYVTHTASFLNVLLTFLGGLIYLIQHRTYKISLIFIVYILNIIFFISWLFSFPYIADTYTLTAVVWSIQNVVILFLLLQDYINKTKQNELLQLQFSKKQNLALQNLLVGQETERKRLSQALHDGLSIHIAQMKQYITTKGISGLPKMEIPKLIKDLDILHQDVRHFSHALNPVVLEQLGFIRAIDNIIFNLENTHIQFEQLEDSLQFTYKDNGVGFDMESMPPGIGLQNIKARTELLKGIFKIQHIVPKGMMQSILLSN